MKNLIFVFLIIFVHYSVNAQLSLDVKEMITIKDKKKSVEKINGKIIINSDTTEIEIHINDISYKERIGEFSSINDFGECKVYIYNQEEGYLVLQILNNSHYSIWFQTKNNKLQFI